MAKGNFFRALLRMWHSPAGKRFLAEEKKKKKTQPVYFKGIRRRSVEDRLRDAGVSEEDVRRLEGKK